MFHSSLQLHHFRNYQNVQTELSPKVNIFLGRNGQGKTNIVEALFLLTQGESFRYGDNSTFIQTNSNEAILKTKLTDHNLDYEVTLQILKSKKNYFLNGKKTTNQNITDKFPVVIFSPESLSSIKEGDDQRRFLVDQHLTHIQPHYRELIQNYKKVLKTRNRVLKDYLEGTRQLNETEDILESLKGHFIESAVDLSFARITSLKGVLPQLNNAMQFISKDRNVDISVEYVISGQNMINSSYENVQSMIEKRLLELHSAELASGVSLVGPQKHDVRFLYNGNDSRFYCSQGQQRALILSYKMAQIVYHRELHGNDPVLILDDVLSELDSEKRLALISFLQEIKSQIFITTTDLNLPKEIQNRETAVFNIENGQIQKL